MRLLIIEDDPSVSSYLCKGFRELGHVVDTADNGRDGLYLATAEDYDVLVVDRMLPQLEGLAVVRTLRASGKTTPALILSALGEVDDRVKGLRAGGDDYLVKPFSFSELAARVDALRRRATFASEAGDVQARLGTVDLEMDLLRRRVTRAGVEIPLKTTEFRLLEFLLRNKGQVVTRTMVIEHVWDYHFDPQTNIVDVHISRLRAKIERDGCDPLIRTVRGTGYLIRD